MARINLLPWREEQRRERQKKFMVSALMTAILGVVLVFIVGMFFDQQIAHQEMRNRTIQAEITRLESQIRKIEQLEQTRARLLSRKRIIERLQASRSLTVELLDQLAKTIPVGITLNTIAQQGMAVSLSGTSQSNARVSAYLQSLADNDLFVEPDLSIVRAADRPENSVEPYDFQIRVKLRPIAEEEDVAPGAVTGGAQ